MCPTTERGCELQPGPVDIPEAWLLPSVGPRVCTGSVKEQKQKQKHSGVKFFDVFRSTLRSEQSACRSSELYWHISHILACKHRFRPDLVTLDNEKNGNVIFNLVFKTLP